MDVWMVGWMYVWINVCMTGGMHAYGCWAVYMYVWLYGWMD